MTKRSVEDEVQEMQRATVKRLREWTIVKSADDYETPKTLWKDLTPSLHRSLTLYDPFYCNGRSKVYLEDLGYKVLSEKTDFLDLCESGTLPDFDVLVTNPPFSKLEIVLPKIVALKKKAIILLPSAVLTRPWTLELLNTATCYAVEQARSVGFIRDGKQMKRPDFPCSWLYLNHEIN